MLEIYVQIAFSNSFSKCYLISQLLTLHVARLAIRIGMKLLSQAEFKTLAEHTGQPCISMYLPMELAGPETRKNPIQLKNALHDAEAQLQARGSSHREVETILQPALALVDDFNFWQHQQAGLALFLTPEGMQSYRLPISFEPMVMVGNRFQLKPLLPLFEGDRPFYILSLSQKPVRLFWANHYQIEEVPLEGIPTTLEEALRYDDPEEQLNFHNVSGDGSVPIYHGHGVGTTTNKDNIRRFFLKLDRGLHDRLNQSGMPLILAGQDFLHPIYRDANSYGNLLDEGVTFDAEHIDPEVLRDAAWETIATRMNQTRHEQIDRFQSLQNTHRRDTALEPVVVAAHRGQVDTLLVNRDSHRWGRYDAEHNTIEPHEDEKMADTDLVDLAAIQTVLQGGKVYLLPPEEMPTEEPVAAIFRYELPTPAGI